MLLYVQDLDDPKSARKYTFLLKDEALKKRIVTAASADASTLSAADAGDMGRWYKTLASTADRPAPLLRRAHAYFTRAGSAEDATGLQKTGAKLALGLIEKQMKDLGASLTPPAGAGKETIIPVSISVPATVYWLMADDMDLYHNGKPLRDYTPSFKTRRDEARMTKPFSAKIQLRAGDVFTSGGRRGGSYGGTVVVTDPDGKLIWTSNTKDWKVYEPADPEKWYLPSVAKKSKKWPVRIARSFGHQAVMKRKYNDIPQPIWDTPEKRFVYMVGIYPGPRPVAGSPARAGTPKR